MSQAELIESARAGDRAAFDELVRQTYVETFTLALRLTSNEEDARDVTQEAYLRAWKGIRGFRGDAQLSTWLYRITANCAASALAKRRRLRTDSLDAVTFEVADDRLEHSPERSADAHVELAELEVALTQLPPKLRAVVVLKDVYGLSHEEIADELGISVSAAKVRLHRARKRLAETVYVEARSSRAV